MLLHLALANNTRHSAARARARDAGIGAPTSTSLVALLQAYTGSGRSLGAYYLSLNAPIQYTASGSLFIPLAVGGY